ncbi:hypothetical protein J2R96_005868 [Bradyrhizobium elkanii]|nr:hypothetical protein [Bradyrhizobium elkanii]
MLRLVPSDAECGPSTEYKRRLMELVHAMDAKHTFHKGQFVRWKAGLKNRGVPAYNEPVVVRKVLVKPVFDMCEAARCSGSPYFEEPLTLVLGIIDPDGDLVELRYDGRRFEPNDV